MIVLRISFLVELEYIQVPLLTIDLSLLLHRLLVVVEAVVLLVIIISEKRYLKINLFYAAGENLASLVVGAVVEAVGVSLLVLAEVVVVCPFAKKRVFFYQLKRNSIGQTCFKRLCSASFFNAGSSFKLFGCVFGPLNPSKMCNLVTSFLL